MDIHEFQAKGLFSQFGIPVPKGSEIKDPSEAKAWADAHSSPVTPLGN